MKGLMLPVERVGSLKAMAHIISLSSESPGIPEPPEKKTDKKTPELTFVNARMARWGSYFNKKKLEGP